MIYGNKKANKSNLIRSIFRDPLSDQNPQNQGNKCHVSYRVKVVKRRRDKKQTQEREKKPDRDRDLKRFLSLHDNKWAIYCSLEHMLLFCSNICIGCIKWEFWNLPKILPNKL